MQFVYSNNLVNVMKFYNAMIFVTFTFNISCN